MEKIVKIVAIALTVVVGFYLGISMGDEIKSCMWDKIDKMAQFALDHILSLSCLAFVLVTFSVIIDRVFKKY